MRSLGFACFSGLALVASHASAADLPARLPAPLPPIPTFTWTGGYFGVNAGYSFDNTARYALSSGNTGAASEVGFGRPDAATVDRDGFTGGGQIGYNYQFGNYGSNIGFGLGATSVVLGFEADAAYMDLDRTKAFTGIDPTTGLPRASTAIHASLDYLGTVRGRAGFAFGQALVYATGGFAYGNVDNAVTFLNANGTQQYVGRKNAIATGYTVGGGIEYALPTGSFLDFFKSSAVTLKAEYLYYDLGSRSFALQGVAGNAAAGTFYQARAQNSGNLARVGLNYKF